MGRPSEEEFMAEEFSADEIATFDAAKSEPAAVVEDDAPKADAAGSDEPEAKTADTPAEPKMVDIRALQEARAAERALREEIARERENIARERELRVRLEERTNTVLQAINAQNKPAEPQPPSEDEDVLGYLKHEIQKTQAQLDAERQWRDQQYQAYKQQEQVQQVITQADSIYEVARTNHPDVNEAFQYAVEATRQDLVKKGYSGPQFDQAMNQIVYEYARRCPPDPDEAANFIRASARYWGWNGAQQAQPNGGGQPSLQDIAARQERHMSLSNAAGGEPPAKIGVKELASMSDDQFKSLMSKMSDKEWERAMGGA